MSRARGFVGGAIALVLVIGSTQAQKEASGPKYVPSADAEFVEMLPGVSKAVLWGDHDAGPYGAFTRMEPGFDSGTHSHSNDTWLVVIEGAYLYKDEAGEKRVGAGDFIFMPGGHTHWSGADPEEGALFYEESSGKFDMVSAE